MPAQTLRWMNIFRHLSLPNKCAELCWERAKSWMVLTEMRRKKRKGKKKKARSEHQSWLQLCFPMTTLRRLFKILPLVLVCCRRCARMVAFSVCFCLGFLGWGVCAWVFWFSVWVFFWSSLQILCNAVILCFVMRNFMLHWRQSY